MKTFKENNTQDTVDQKQTQTQDLPFGEYGEKDIVCVKTETLMLCFLCQP